MGMGCKYTCAYTAIKQFENVADFCLDKTMRKVMLFMIVCKTWECVIGFIAKPEIASVWRLECGVCCKPGPDRSIGSWSCIRAGYLQ